MMHHFAETGEGGRDRLRRPREPAPQVVRRRAYRPSIASTRSELAATHALAASAGSTTIGADLERQTGHIIRCQCKVGKKFRNRRGAVGQENWTTRFARP